MTCLGAEEQDWISLLLEQQQATWSRGQQDTTPQNSSTGSQSEQQSTMLSTQTADQQTAAYLDGPCLFDDLILPDLDTLLQEPLGPSEQVCFEDACRQLHADPQPKPLPPHSHLPCSGCSHEHGLKLSRQGVWLPPQLQLQSTAQPSSSQDSAQHSYEAPADSGNSCVHVPGQAHQIQGPSCQAVPPRPPSQAVHGSPAGSGQLDPAPQAGRQPAQQPKMQAPVQVSSEMLAFAEGPAAPADSEEAKRQARMQRNRESAHISRQRKKLQAGDLENRCQELQAHNAHLTGLVTQLSSEVNLLRHQLVMASAQSGQQFKAPFGLPPAGVHAHPIPGAYNGLPLNPGSFSPMPMGTLPKVPIQKVKVQRPIHVDAMGAAIVPGSSRSKKRGRLTAVTSAVTATAMLALCCVAMFAGPWGPQTAPQATHMARLPAQHPSRTARTLQALHEGGVDSASALDLAKGAGPRPSQMSPALPEEWLSPWNQSSNASWDSVSLLPFNSHAEARALEHLKEVGPVAVLSDWDFQSRAGPGQQAWRSFPQLAGSALARDGLLSPSACQEVFSISTDSIPDVTGAKMTLKRHLAELSTFRGRPVGSLAMLPMGMRNQEGPQEDPLHMAQSSSDSHARIGCANSTEQASISKLAKDTSPIAQPAASSAGK